MKLYTRDAGVSVCKPVKYFITVFLVALIMNTKSDELSRTRLKEVAGMVTSVPIGFGRKITDRQSWQRLNKLKCFQKVYQLAIKNYQKPIPKTSDDLYLDFSRTGNRTRWQNINFQRRMGVGTLTIAECLENQGRFLPKLEKLIREICKERTWLMPAHDRSLRNFKGTVTDIDLGSAMLGLDLATMDYLLGDRLKSETRKLIRANLKKRIFTPFTNMASGKRKPNWWFFTTNNWNAVCLAGVVGAALTIIESPEKRAGFIVAAEHYSKNFLKGFGRDGYCSEGLGYWNYGFGHYVILSEIIYLGTGGKVRLLECPGVLPAAQFPLRIEIINGVYPAFADCPVSSRPDYDLMQYLNRYYDFGLSEYKGKTTTKCGRFYSAMAYTFSQAEASKTFPPKNISVNQSNSIFNESQVYICRPGENTRCKMGVAIKGGHNQEHHNHNDVGAYVVVIGKVAVLLDPGTEVYTARTFSSRRYESNVLNSYGHPVPVISGKLQKTGKKAAAKCLDYTSRGKRTNVHLDITAAYGKTGTKLEKLIREFNYDRSGCGKLTVIDIVEFKTSGSFETAIITLGEWQRKSDNSLYVYWQDQAVNVSIDTGGIEFDIIAETLKEDVKTPSLPTRIGIRLRKPVKNVKVKLIITPAASRNSAEKSTQLKNGSFDIDSFSWNIPKESSARSVS